MTHFETICMACEAPAAPHAVRCASCGGLLGFRYDETDVRWDDARLDMWRYRALLPVADPAHVVSLGEGGTPLLPSRERAGVWLKDETRNPTGSHKDRQLAVALSQARALGRPASALVTAGSTGVANAAMSARAGLRAIVVAPRGTPAERLHPARELGAEVLYADGPIDTVIEELQAMGERGEVYVSSTARSSNPYQAEGPKTIAYEIAEQLGGAPDVMVVPVGGGGTVAGIWRGFRDLRRLGRIERLPRLIGMVARGYDAIAQALEAGIEDPCAVMAAGHVAPPTVLVKIAHVFPPDGVEGLAALRDSGGTAMVVHDEEALAAQLRLGAQEGIYVEPSSASCLIGLERGLEQGLIEPGERVVVLLSGSGFRESFVSLAARPLDAPSVALDELATTIRALAGDRDGVL